MHALSMLLPSLFSFNYQHTVSLLSLLFLFPDLGCSVQTEDGDACVFPFTYNGFVFHGCTDYDVYGPDIKPWCFTSSWWGYCAGIMCAFTFTSLSVNFFLRKGFIILYQEFLLVLFRICLLQRSNNEWRCLCISFFVQRFCLQWLHRL